MKNHLRESQVSLRIKKEVLSHVTSPGSLEEGFLWGGAEARKISSLYF
jgi:hypothetical protein